MEPLKNMLPTAIRKLWLQMAYRSLLYRYLLIQLASHSMTRHAALAARRECAIFAQSLRIS